MAMSGIVRGGIRLVDALSRLLFAAAVGIVAAIVLLVIYDVASRNLRLPTLPGAVTTVEFALFFVTFLALPWLVRTRGHVAVEIVFTALSLRARRVLELVLHLVAAVMCAALALRSGSSMVDALLSGDYEVRSYDMPMWLLYAAMMSGFGLGALQFLAFPLRGESFYGADPAHAAAL